MPTLVDVQETLAQLAGENGLRQVSEVLLYHVGHVEGRLVLEGEAVRVGLDHVPKILNPRFDPRLPEKANLLNIHDQTCTVLV